MRGVTVWIDPKGLVCGHASMEVRRLFQRLNLPFACYHDRYIERVLNVSPQRATQLRECLMAEGYLEPARLGRDGWEPTTKGLALAQASAAPPLTRATAQRRLEDFLDRVEKVNAGDYAYRVSKVAVFGSYLSDAPRINDVDVMVDLPARHDDIPDHLAHCKRRIALAKRNGRSFAYYGHEMLWPRHEVLYALKARSQAIAIHVWEEHEHFLDTRPHRIVYEESPGGTGAP
jgi:hypothetical protein